MGIKTSDFAPYPTYILARCANASASVFKLLDEIAEHLAISNGDSSSRRRTQPAQSETKGELSTAFLTYSKPESPSWLAVPHPAFVETHHHLLLVSGWSDFLAIYGSESSACGAIASSILSPPLEADGSLLSQISAIPADLLNGAFLTGKARTLWLSGIHRRSPTKADSKILAGQSLEDSLSPLGDQSYMFTAARSASRIRGLPMKRKVLSVGVVPRKSRIWTSPVATWEIYRDTTLALLQRLKASDKPSVRTYSPLPVLASEVAGVAGIARAYDMCLVSPDVLDPSEADESKEEELKRLNEWSSEAVFIVDPQPDSTVKATARLYGQDVATVQISWASNAQGDLASQIQVSSIGKSNKQAAQDLRTLCRKPGWLTVYFGSGHTYAGGRMYAVKYRDIAFSGWRSVSMKGFDVTKEKPGPPRSPRLADIGKEDSLFCWVAKNWPLETVGSHRGWLSCDDGSGEIADFIHVSQPSNKPAIVTLIHVKAASTSSATRQVSTAAYEIVSSQALKNLRFVDRINLRSRLAKHPERPTWLNGKLQKSRAGLLSALEAIGDDLEKRVVILQPSLTRTELRRLSKEASASRMSESAARFRQLNTLMAAAASDCQQLQATLTVLIAD